MPSPKSQSSESRSRDEPSRRKLTPGQSPEPRPPSKLGDSIFAVFHLLLLAAIVVYAFIGLFQGNTLRFAVILAGLVLYYFLVLHKPVMKEITRKRELKSLSPSKRA
jgi:hypothetical protein